jgi:hypothetical protein
MSSCRAVREGTISAILTVLAILDNFSNTNRPPYDQVLLVLNP